MSLRWLTHASLAFDQDFGKDSEKDTQALFKRACDLAGWGKYFSHALADNSPYKNCFDAKTPSKVRSLTTRRVVFQLSAHSRQGLR